MTRLREKLDYLNRDAARSPSFVCHASSGRGVDLRSIQELLLFR